MLKALNINKNYSMCSDKNVKHVILVVFKFVNWLNTPCIIAVKNLSGKNMYYAQSQFSYVFVASSLRRIDIHHTQSNRFTCKFRFHYS